MFQGRGQIALRGEEYEATLNMPNDYGVYEIGAQTKDEALDRLDFVASFFSTHEMVGPRALEVARRLRSAYLNPDSKAKAEKTIDALIENVHRSGKAYDVLYALRKLAANDNRAIISGDEIAIGLRLGKKLKKLIKKKNLLYAAFPPALAAKATLNVARWAIGKRKAKLTAAPPPKAARTLAKAAFEKKDPVALGKIKALASMATGAPATDQKGEAPTEEVREQAAQALVNLQKASEEEGYAPSDDEGLDYADSMEASMSEEDYGEDVSGDEEDEESEVAGDEESEEIELGSLLSFVKKIGPALDPSRKGSLAAAAVSSIPGVGPGIVNAANLVAQAKAGAKDAANKLKDIKDLSNAGVPAAQKAQANVDAAKKLGNKVREQQGNGRSIGPRIPWFPFREIRHLGATGG